jgi:hypothetical protein
MKEVNKKACVGGGFGIGGFSTAISMLILWGLIIFGTVYMIIGG